MKLKILFRNGARETIELEKPDYNELYKSIKSGETKVFDKGIINLDEVVLIWEAESQSTITK